MFSGGLLCWYNVKRLGSATRVGTFPVQHVCHHLTFCPPDRGPTVVTLRADVCMSHSYTRRCYQHCQHSYIHYFQSRQGSSYQVMQDCLNQHTVVCEGVCCHEDSVEEGEVNGEGSQQENTHLCGQGDQWEAYGPQKVWKSLRTYQQKVAVTLL